MLRKKLVGLGVQRRGCGIPDDPVDADGLAAGAILRRPRPRVAVACRGLWAKRYQEDRGAGDGRDISRASKRDREARQDVEAVEHVEVVQVVAIAGLSHAVREGQVDLAVREVGQIRHSKAVARKRCLFYHVWLKERLYAGDADRRHKQAQTEN